MDTTGVEDETAEPEPVVLRTPAQFKAPGHPVRHRIVNVLRQRPATLRQLGSVLGLATGTISFHIRVLREAGLVRLAATQHVRDLAARLQSCRSQPHPTDTASGEAYGLLVSLYRADIPKLPVAK